MTKDMTKELTIDTLDQVSGGTLEESAQLKEAILSNRYLKKAWKAYERFAKIDEALACSIILDQYLHIKEGWGPEIANTYNGGEYTHEEVLELIKGYEY
ncbi:MAG: hypothetical protein K5745_01180 [Saccharofermentans sp.]|nr:hypothetical protein [Saccharofermentans sp.]